MNESELNKLVKMYDVELLDAQAEQFFKSIFGLGKTLAIDGYSPDQEKIKDIAGNWEGEDLCNFVLEFIKHIISDSFDLGNARLILYGSQKKGCFLHIYASIEISAGPLSGASNDEMSIGTVHFWVTKNLNPEIQLVYIDDYLIRPKHKTFLLTKDEKVIKKFEGEYIRNTKK